jgi:DNA-binding NarL/FixJ family response regulator
VKTPLRLLLIEDSENDALLLLRELERGPYEIICERVCTATAMAAQLEKHEWDIVISDYSLPAFDALEALSLIKEKRSHVPFLIVSGAVEAEREAAALKAGARAFLLKDKLAELLLPAVERELSQRC